MIYTWTYVHMHIHTHMHTLHISQNHFSPMHIAAHANQISVISVLLSHEPNLLNFPSGRGETPVMIACLAGHKQAVECLQQCRADLSLTSADESTVLHYAASSNASDVMEYILYVTDQDCINRKNNVSKQMQG